MPALDAARTAVTVDDKPAHPKHIVELPREQVLAKLERTHLASKVRPTEIEGKGRGVVALVDIAAGELFEVAPVLVVKPPQADDLMKTVLEFYVYEWPEGTFAVALGYGSLYNHSYAPNAVYRKDFAHAVIEYRALAPIAAGAEITINYNGDPADQTPVWFDEPGAND